MNLPLEPFFVYKTDVFDEFKQRNPQKKLSELTALIADSWTNLDAETKGKYEKKYGEALEKFNQSLVTPISCLAMKDSLKRHAGDTSRAAEPTAKKANVLEKGNVLTRIYKSITLEQNQIRDQRNGIYDTKVHTLKPETSSNYHDTMSSAICHIQKEFWNHMLDYEGELRSIDWFTNGWGWCGGWIPKMERIAWDFDATITNVEKGSNYKFENSKYLSVLNEKIGRIPITKRYLTINILREKDFSPQAIKDVLTFLPNKIYWKVQFRDGYYWERDVYREFGSDYRIAQFDEDYAPLSFYPWKTENDLDDEHCGYKEGDEYGFQDDNNGKEEDDKKEENLGEILDCDGNDEYQKMP